MDAQRTVRRVEFALGSIELDLEQLVFTGSCSYDAPHKFIVSVHRSRDASPDVAKLYVAQLESHPALVSHFKLQRRTIAGGGSCYIDAHNRLVLDDASGDFGSIPSAPLTAFSVLLTPHLAENYSVHAVRCVVDPIERFKGISLFHHYWNALGFVASPDAK